MHKESKKKLLKILASGLGVIFVIAGFIVGVVLKERASSPYNALFNVGSAGEIGFWIYSLRGNCPSLRSMDKNPIVLITLPSYSGHGRVDVKSLRTCMELQVENPRNPRTLPCKDGFLSVDNHGDSKERSGSFSVTLADGRVRSGEFVAGVCAAD